MEPKPAESLAERVAALSSPDSQPDRSEVDELLTECAAARLAIGAETSRVDRRLLGSALTVAKDPEALTEVRQLAAHRDELDAEQARLAKLIAELRARRDSKRLADHDAGKSGGSGT